MGSTSPNKLLTWLLIILLCYVYYRHNSKRVLRYEVLQVTPSQLTFDVLNERNPVVLRKGDKDICDVIDEAMRYTYLYRVTDHHAASPDRFKPVVGRYIVLVPQGPVEVEIIHPGHVGKDDYKSISLKLDRQTVAILPTYWAYRESGAIESIVIHDVFSSVRSMMFVENHNGRVG
jgi:hypothetical protein